MANNRLPTFLDLTSLLGTTINTALALRHSLRARGGRRTALFAALGIGLPSLAEWYAVNIDRGLHHHTRPHIQGVPLGAAFGWCTIASATHTLVEEALAGAALGERTRRWVTPVGTALVATSLDLLLDPFGLALGLWEWRDDGPYAREIAGPNGRSGIPIGNYLAWLGLIGGVTALYGALADRQPAPPLPPTDTARAAAQILLPYYLPAALWAIGRRRPKYLLYSALFPLTIAIALRRHGARSSLTPMARRVPPPISGGQRQGHGCAMSPPVPRVCVSLTLCARASAVETPTPPAVAGTRPTMTGALAGGAGQPTCVGSLRSPPTVN